MQLKTKLHSGGRVFGDRCFNINTLLKLEFGKLSINYLIPKWNEDAICNNSRLFNEPSPVKEIPFYTRTPFFARGESIGKFFIEVVLNF